MPCDLKAEFRNLAPPLRGPAVGASLVRAGYEPGAGWCGFHRHRVRIYEHWSLI